MRKGKGVLLWVKRAPVGDERKGGVCEYIELIHWGR